MRLSKNLFGHELNIHPDDDERPYTQYEKNRGEIERKLLIKSAILICIFYGVISVIFLIISIFSPNFKNIFLNELFPFIVTFIISALIIMIYLSIKIAHYKPRRIIKHNNDNDDDLLSCPDYWTLSDNGNPAISKYVCTQNNDIYSKENTFKFDPNMKITNTTKIEKSDNKVSLWDSNSNNFSKKEYHLYKNLNDSDINSKLNMSDTQISKFQDLAMVMANYGEPNSNGIYLPTSSDNKLSPIIKNTVGVPITIQKKNGTNAGTEVPLICDQVYPKVLSIIDNKLNPDGYNNKLHCAYAKTCGVTWSDANCE